MSSDDDDLQLDSIFTEPPRPPTPEPKFSTYIREDTHTRDSSDWKEIRIRLVGSHPLWAHYLWNASLAITSYLDSNIELYKSKDVLELGAGGALPSIVVSLNGARKTVITDYPDTDLLENIRFNVASNVINQDRVEVQGYIWGYSLECLLPCTRTGKFELILLSDLLFNHSQHDALIETCNQALAPSKPESSIQPCVLCFFTHHRPHLAHKDMQFFTKAKENGWRCEKILTKIFSPMFDDDTGDETVRSTVHGWKLTKNLEIQKTQKI